MLLKQGQGVSEKRRVAGDGCRLWEHNLKEDGNGLEGACRADFFQRFLLVAGDGHAGIQERNVHNNGAKFQYRPFFYYLKKKSYLKERGWISGSNPEGGGWEKSCSCEQD